MDSSINKNTLRFAAFLERRNISSSVQLRSATPYSINGKSEKEKEKE